MEIITTKDNFGRELKYIQAGLVKGKNYLKSIGYSPSPNPLYMKRGNEYFHFNKIMRIWIYDKVNENKSTVFSGEF